jgi:thioredoxin reductase
MREPLVEQRVWDVAIVGGGAAGLSAALVLGRARRHIVVFDDNRPRNAAVRKMHGFLTREGINPREFIAIARDQMERYPCVEQVAAHVASATTDGRDFTVAANDGQIYRARTVLLATGVYDDLPSIDGLQDLWGRKAFVCPYCDGWEVADRRIAVVGKARSAVQLAQELRQWSRDLLVCIERDTKLTKEDHQWLSAVGVELHNARIASLRDVNGRVTIQFEGGGHACSDAVFLTAPLRQRYPLVDMLGVRVRSDGEIDADSHGRTNVAGCYAAGDAVTTVHQVTLAAASGTCAAMAINEDLTSLEVREAIDAQRSAQ